MNPWKILGVNRAMSTDDIHAAYIKLARRYHPDVSQDKQQFSVITGAYALLKDKEETKAFIAQLKAIGTECAVCKGQGATYKQCGLISRHTYTCENCEGSGIILKPKKEKRK